MKHLYATFVGLILFLTFYGQSCPGTGSINFQRWNNINGSAVSNLTSNQNYPNSPSATGTLTLFETPVNTGNNIGVRINGYICPPITGNYVFWIASDASGELWLSTSANPSSKTRIAFNTNATKYREWNKYTSQKSVAINLTAGQVYYVEALMKESTGNDNLSVGWAKPGQPTGAPSEVIPGSSLLTQLPDTQPPTAPTNLSSSNITFTSFTLSWSAATDNVGVTGYDVYQNGLKINPSNITSTSFNVSGLTAGTTYSYFVKARDAAGNQSTASTSLNVTTNAADTEPPTSPANLAAANITTTTFTLAWQPSTDNVGVTGYNVFKNGVKMNSANITGTAYSVTGLSPNTPYSMTVVARDAAGNQSTSSAMTVVTIPSTPVTETFSVRTVVASQRMPHDLVYGPDDNLWYTERFAGKVSFVVPATGVKTTVLTLGSKMVLAGGQDGLMGLALHPEFLSGKPYVYISYTYQSLSSTVRKTRIERYTYNFTTKVLEQPVTVLENIPGSNDHNSARIAIGPDLKLYYTVGDMGAGQFDNASRTNNAQNLTIYEGKILRLNTEPDGFGSWIPSDNPFTNGGQPTAVFTFGHRNPQGLVWGNVNGTDILYSSEHGPWSDDEVNIIERSRNYGWPRVAGFCDGNYNGITMGGFAVVDEQANCATLNAKEPLRSIFPAINPPTGGDLMTWPTMAPSGTDFYGSNAIPGWQNSLLIATLKSGKIIRYKLSNDGQSIISDTINYFKGLGRYRDVAVSADGLKIYVACDSTGNTSGPTGNVLTTPPNPGSILEFTYQSGGSTRAINQLLTESKVQDDLSDKSIDVYPNPAIDYFVIYNYKLSNSQIQLYDISGKLIKNMQSKDLATRVDVGNLANGVYILTIKNTDSKNIRTEKIVIAR